MVADILNTRVARNPTGTIENVGIKESTAGNTRTTFGGTSLDTSYIGNLGDNTVTFTGTATNPLISTGSGNDTLVANDISNGTISLGNGNNSAVTGGMQNTTVTSGTGADEVTILGDASSVKVSTSSGNDTLIFGGAVSNSTVFLGRGADMLDFSTAVQNTWVDLGNDADIDQVFFNARGDIGTGTQIFGADTGDLLIIGGEEYAFDTEQSAFISSQGDSITFG
jgi:hypothetical protein